MLSVLRSASSPSVVAAVRDAEFGYLDEQGLCYLDYTGAALPARSQLDAQQDIIRARVLGNPHSLHRASRRSTDAIEEARAAVLRFLDADPAEYATIFAANASAAVKLVAESFPFTRESTLVLSRDNHNSVNGIREFAARGAAHVRHIGLDAELRLSHPRDVLSRVRRRGASLFAFPAQSNFSGVKHSLTLVGEAQRLGYRVLLDAAAFLPSQSLSLRGVKPDFLALSMYKLFGFPAGVGALVARRDALAVLARPWFAGGTVDWVSTRHRMHRLREGVEGFEDGTPNFSGLAALRPGLEFMERVGRPDISAHVDTLTATALRMLRSRRHANGTPVFLLYGPTTTVNRGGTIAFNVQNAGGSLVHYEHVEAWAARHDVAIRGGCFCNPGASEAAFRLDGPRLRRCLEASREGPFTPRRLGDCLGGAVPVGALRISVGLANHDADLERAIDCIAAAVGA